MCLVSCRDVTVGLSCSENHTGWWCLSIGCWGIEGGINGRPEKTRILGRCMISTVHQLLFEVNPRRGHEDFTVSLTSVVDGGWVFNATPRPLCFRERPGTLCIGGWVGPGPVWTGAENLVSTGIRSPDSPARRKSLYRLSYRRPHQIILGLGNWFEVAVA